MQDIICHGVPSPKVWIAYKKFREQKNGNSKTTDIQFRNKTAEGWNRYHVKMQFYNNEIYDIEHGKDIYIKAFLSNIALRDSCTNCKFKKENKASDITLADFWGINNIKPNMNDEKWTSLVIVNSEKGKALFEEGNPAGIKAALHAAGIIRQNTLRLPLTPVSDALYNKIIGLLKLH